MAKAKTTPGAKASRTKANSNPIPESTVSSSVGNEAGSPKSSNDATITNTNKNQAGPPLSAAGSRVPAGDVVVAASGTTPAEAVAETKTASKSNVGSPAKSEPEAKPSIETKSAPEPRKLEVVKSDVKRNTVVPINLEDEIRRRAYELYVQRGSIGGSEAEDWLRAEREIRQRYEPKQQSA